MLYMRFDYKYLLRPRAVNVTYTLVKIRPRVFGGKEVKLAQLKHHVFIKKLTNTQKKEYRAICSGNIITPERVLSSAHCFLTNQKRDRQPIYTLRVVAGVLVTYAHLPESDDVQQWRSIHHIYSQKFFRFPAYNLAVLEMDRPWIFNQFVNKIPYASKDQDFDGVCKAIAVKPVKSWSQSRTLFWEDFKMMTRDSCENALLRSCRLYHCTEADSARLLLDSVESEGGGLICHGTGDPEEVDENQGVLVGITSLIFVKLPTLHHKVSLFHKWVTDDATMINCVDVALLLFCFLIKFSA
ncbi:hypothetical protein ABMA27_002537 [Loxostege sticticalis]|uniref:Peptidase S1 domain-containing protein n=1 Tax=Loxostege sticticalis TaxID=481309 RepID=A0ABR3HU06_LOXSC